MRGFQNEYFGRIFKTPGQSPQTQLLIYTTSSKPSKKSLLERKREREKKKHTKKEKTDYNNQAEEGSWGKWLTSKSSQPH